jgi:hypothetical protein
MGEDALVKIQSKSCYYALLHRYHVGSRIQLYRLRHIGINFYDYDRHPSHNSLFIAKNGQKWQKPQSTVSEFSRIVYVMFRSILYWNT